MTPETISGHARDYHRLLRALSKDQIDFELAAEQERLNRNLASLIREPGDVR
jgi:hypothetical protein